jgi:hypothetical protein
MAGHAVTELSPAALRGVDAWMAAVAARLPGPARARRAILAELQDGLLVAVAAGRERGLPAAQAARDALREFGDPGLVAAAFRPELAVAQARGVALGLIRSGPLVGLVWGGAAIASQLASPAPPWRWPGPPGVRLAFPLIAAMVAAALLGAILVVASTGRLSRWAAVPAGLPLAAAGTVGIAAVGVDLTMLVMLTTQLLAAPGSLAWAPVGLAATVSLTRLLVAGRATRRLLALRANAA